MKAEKVNFPLKQKLFQLKKESHQIFPVKKPFENQLKETSMNSKGSQNFLEFQDMNPC